MFESTVPGGASVAGAHMPTGAYVPPPRGAWAGGAGGWGRGGVEPRVAWWQREGVIARVLAVAGAGVTLIGVLMLLVLAAQAGFFGPVARVVAGGAISVALVAAGCRVMGRAGGRVGGLALVSTGIAGVYLDVVAVTGFYRWVPGGVGLAVALLVALAGVGLAMRWQSQPLAVGVVVGAAVLSPAVASGLMLLAFLVVLQAAGVPVQMRRDWPVLHVARTLPVVLTALGLIAIHGFEAGISGEEVAQRQGLLVAAIACAVVGITGALLTVRRRGDDITAGVTVALTALPVLAAALLFDRAISACITGVLAAALLTVGATALRPKVAARLRIPGHTSLVAALTGAVALLQTCTMATGGESRLLPTALFTVGLAFLGVAAATRTRVCAGLGVAFALLGGLVLFAIANPEILAAQSLAIRHLTGSTAAAALLGLATAALVGWTVRRLRGGTDALSTGTWIIVSVAGLYFVLVVAVSTGVTLGGTEGFLVGHGVATIIWMVAATAALFVGLRMLRTAPAVAKVYLVSGLVVVAAALAKLFLFDLATLSGLVRVAAFLAVGTLLLLTGTRYAQAFASPDRDDSTS
ncbi:putative membrane protein DUF2339 [Nocardia caishijiensis]|uniref:Membrane protein DUF2339 n=1 Tax=Nocardia caishijiensis TaxID=184756 RepID=A0ABQ6YUT1_9NOCA|nr:putative membrane protein DUF2339 [Nocardia caishijiensis]